ncbi:MAG: hypothetical protein AB7D57_02455 [Desulfovibrionaceae bacterium]
MGKVLQIRVSASTYDESQVGKRWPRLTAHAWGVDADAPGHGVLALIETIEDKARLGLLDFKPGPDFERALAAVTALRDRMEAALADWRAGEANRLSDELEDALGDLEKAAEKV